MGGPQGRSGRVENLVPTGIRSRTVQPVINRYTDWATGPVTQNCIVNNLSRNSLNILTEQLEGCATHLMFLRSLHQQTCASEKQEHLSCSWSSLDFQAQSHLHFFSTFVIFHNLQFEKPKFCFYPQHWQKKNTFLTARETFCIVPSAARFQSHAGM